MPPDSINTFDKFWHYKEVGSSTSFFGLKVIYYYSHFSKEDAENKIKEFIKSLPFIKKTFEDPKFGFTIITETEKTFHPSWPYYKNYFNKEYQKVLNKNQNNKKIELDEINMTYSILQKGGVYTIFTKGESAISWNFKNVKQNLLEFIEIYTNSKLTIEDKAVKCKTLDIFNGISLKSFKELLNNPIDNSFILRVNELSRKNDTNYKIQDKNNNIQNKFQQNNSNKSSTTSTDINFSPDKNTITYICPYTFDDAFTLYSQEQQYINNDLSGYQYSMQSYIDNSNDEDADITLNTWKNISGGLVFISAHGLPNLGVVLTYYTNQSDAEFYIDNDNFLFFEPTNFSGSEVYAVIAPDIWWAMHTKGTLDFEKSIVFLSVCYGFGVSESIGGGAVFSYDVITDFQMSQIDFDKIFNKMNGNQGTARSAGEAKAEYWNTYLNLFPSNATITLCPATKSYFPDPEINPTVMNEGDGYFEVDTWCDPSNTPVYDAISFVTSGVTISDVAWDNSSMTNKINFHWNGQGTVTVNVNSSAFHSWGNGGDANGYNILDYNKVTPNGDNGSYTFNTSSTISSPIANFSYDSQSAQSPDYTVYFSDLSQYTPTSWSWNFGDGYTSSQQNPSHSYFNYGSYTVSLTVSNQWGTNSISKSITINSNNTTEPLSISCNVNSTVAYVYQPFVSECQIWSGTPPFLYEFRYIVNNELVSSQTFNDEYSFTKSATITLGSTPETAKLYWSVTDANNNHESCYDLIDVVVNNDADAPIIADFTWAENCDYVVDINNPVTFVDMSYSTEPVNCPIAYWEWAFDWDTNSDDCPWIHVETNPCHWDLNYSNYQSTVSHPYPTIGVKTIRLMTSSWYDPNATGGHNLPDGNCGKRGYKWGGIYVIDCDYTSTYIHLTHFEGFIGAIRNNDWDPDYIYGGTFNINGNANNYLNSSNIVISACKEIVVSGDVEFIALGDHELVLEINDNECLQNSTKNIIDLFSGNEDNSINDLTELKNDTIDNENNFINSFPNPFVSEIEITTNSNTINSIKLIDINGKIIILEKFDSPINYWKLNTKDLIPGVYLLEVNGLIDKYTKKIIKTSNTL